MFKIKSKILKKLSAGFMAGLCAFSMLGSTMSGVITANAASTSTENSAFPSADMVIAKAATLLGSPYTFGNKGYWYAYNQGQYTPLSVQTINNLEKHQDHRPSILGVFQRFDYYARFCSGGSESIWRRSCVDLHGRI